MKKFLLWGSGVVLLTICLIGGWSFRTKTTTSQPTAAKVQTHHKKKTTKPLTLTELKRHDTLAYSSIIYYAIKYGKIQRWQELSDFSLGWQVESYSSKSKYLVWPDQNIKDEAKQLAPNWFKLQGSTVTYHSFVVHSFQDDMTAKVSLTTIINRINREHAEAKVRQMPTRLTVIRHH
ncbi:hypothetical protein [Lactobacillus plantarum] [Lactiplantibacillus mudanjiangensis]|uniref:hypothetical protein n=1 Tax=Lactiplantibacillus mudanjiangensis TaxID=1296538 RepID=UPI0010140D8B|nr:hypothetical protein [Lactobacillus plantarum] [Lactiplantibacillus mudanjiangensis]